MRFPKLFSRTQNTPEQKSSRTGALFAIFSDTRPYWSPKNYSDLAREGYANNPVAYRCVRMIAEAVASLPLVMYDGFRELDKHPLLDLLARPNPRETRTDLLEAVAGHLLVAGNAYIELVAVADEPRELYALRPDRNEGRTRPRGLGRGLLSIPSPERAFASTWARRCRRSCRSSCSIRPTITTACRPSSPRIARSTCTTPRAPGTRRCSTTPRGLRARWSIPRRPETSRRISSTAEERTRTEFQGAQNAGRPLLLEGGLDWKSLSMSPKDMDFIEAKHASAREIALAFGVPPMLLGIPGDNTFSNYMEANRSFHRGTVVPLANRLLTALVNWLSTRLRRRAEARARSRSGAGALQRARFTLEARE